MEKKNFSFNNKYQLISKDIVIFIHKFDFLTVKTNGIQKSHCNFIIKFIKIVQTKNNVKHNINIFKLNWKSNIIVIVYDLE